VFISARAAFSRRSSRRLQLDRKTFRNESGPLGCRTAHFSLVDLSEVRSVARPAAVLESIVSLIASRMMSSIVSPTL